MSFAADAIGFWLQLRNELSPELKVAAKDYERFTKALDKWNTKAYKSASKGLGALSNLVESFEALPKKAVKSYNEALSRIKRSIKPITQPLVLQLSPKGEKALGKSVARAVSKVLSKVNIRLSATAPIKRSKFFDTSVSMRSAYKDMLQPPDFLGAFQHLPRFQKGGIVPGPGGVDEILALLTPGEAVIPADVVQELRTMAKGKFVSKGLAEALANIRNIAAASEKLTELAEEGIDPKAQTRYNDAMEAMNEELVRAKEHFGKMAPSLRRDLLPALEKTTGQLEEFRDRGEEATGTFTELLEDTLGPTRFLAIHEALGTLQEGLQSVSSAASQVGSEVGVTTDQLDNFITNLNEVNVTLNLSRKELSVLKADLLKLSKEEGLDPTAMGEAVEGLVSAGVRSGKQLRNLAGVAALVGTTTTLSFDEAAEQVGRLNDEFSWSRDQITAYFMTLKKQSAAGWIDFQVLSQQSMEMISTGFLAAFNTEEAQKSALENMGAFSTAMSSQWQATGTEMAQLFAKAMTDVDVRGQVAKIGVSFEDLQTAVMKGDFTGVMRGMASTFAGMTSADSLVALEQFRQAVGFEGTAQELLNISKNAEVTIDMLGDLRGQTVDTANAHDAATEAVGRALTGWEKMRIGIKNTILAWTPEPVIEFFDDVNPQILLSIGYLTKMGLEAIFAAGRFVKGFSSMAKAGVGWIAQKLGLMAKASTSVTEATTKGAAAPGFFAGLAGGLKALTPALEAFGKSIIGYGGLGLLAFIGTLYAIVAAARLAVPVIEALGAAIATIIEPMFEAFKVMDAGQILALAAAFVVFGPSLALFGQGVQLMSLGLAAAVPGLLIFAGAMALISPEGMEGGISGAINGLLAAFQVDQSKLDAALMAVRGTVEFITGFVAVSAVMAGLAVTSMVTAPLKVLTGIFGLKSPMEALATSQGRAVASTIRGLLATFNFSGAEVKKLQGVQTTVSAVAAFTSGYRTIASDLKGVTPSLISGMRGGIIGAVAYLGVGSPMRALRLQGGEIVDTVRNLIATFNFTDAELRGLVGVQKQVEALARFTGSYTQIAKGLQDVAPGILDRATDAVLALFGSESAMQRLGTQAPDVIETLNAVVRTFAGALPFLEKHKDAAIQAIGLAAEVVKSFNPLAEAVAETGENIGNLVDGWIFSGTLTILKDGLPKFREGIQAIVAELGLLKGQVGKVTAGALQETVDLATIAVEGLARPVAAIEPLAKAMKRVKDSSKAIITQRGPVLAALRAAITTAEGLSQEFSRPVVARAELERTVRVELDPNTTDKPVHETLLRTNELLTQLIGAVGEAGAGRLGGVPAGLRARAGTRARGVDADTRAISEGERF
jgi:hypothetical protein